MPIKFRCQKCRQLLGIAKSQAGAFVDCPQCGRSVKVPRPKAFSGTPIAASTHQRDQSLTDALAQLSELSTPGEGGPVSGFKHDLAAVGVSPDVAVQQQPMAVQAHSIEEYSRDISAITEPQAFVEEHPVSLEDSLSELAEFESVSSHEVSGELLEEMRAARRPQMSVFSALFLTVAVASLAIAGSWWWQQQQSQNDPQQITALKPGQPDDNGKADVDFLPPQTRILSGLIQYQANAGQLLPDSGALVMALPEQREGTLKLDGRTLRQPASHPDRRMTVAALKSLGADVAIADDEGRYSIQATDRCQLVVISRYVAGDADTNPSRDLLTKYFESTSRLIGQLKFQQQAVDVSDQVDFLFSSSK